MPTCGRAAVPILRDAPDVGAVFENIEYAFGQYAIALWRAFSTV